MRRPRKSEIIGAVLGAGVGAGIGVAVEGLPPDVFSGDIGRPPSHSAKADGVDESRRVAGSLFGRQQAGVIKAKMPDANANGGVGPKPDDSAWQDYQENKRSLLDDVAKELRRALPDYKLSFVGRDLSVMVPGGAPFHAFTISPETSNGSVELKWPARITEVFNSVDGLEPYQVPQVMEKIVEIVQEFKKEGHAIDVWAAEIDTSKMDSVAYHDYEVSYHDRYVAVKNNFVAELSQFLSSLDGGDKIRLNWY